MAYNKELAERIRNSLNKLSNIEVEEKKMFGGLAFMVNGKMCINASGDRLMCRFDPANEEMISQKSGYEPMIMKGRKYKGYCYVNSAGYIHKTDFDFWIQLCLEFNKSAKSSKKNG
ncbi:TfoX/Sxy family protein [Membranihabitans maritimus]|uniref:TfoX/Sxy family protein n=1 Tax=Membranihabitans maritimus TaxID=2904244 RepID=UPI001F42BDC0|nr:TfoX/Sxy family protein [Membranihabitans maritimus]